ncbi:DNA-binding response regulator [Lewinellaceae bacterium SD302]|nr:DNA-binding response regulator [Lewinellaceae bacterium SD302]
MFYLQGMKILIVEDEALFADQIEMLCEQLGYEVVATCEDAFSALDAFHRLQPDLLLSDINLVGETDGIQLAEKLNSHRSIPTIFITSLADDATFLRASAILPVGFIVKPFNQLQLQRSIELAVSQLVAKEEETVDFAESDLQLADSFFIKVGNKLEKVRTEDIVYVEADGRYSMIHTLQARKFAVRIPISEMAAKLNQEQFLRSHRSYLANLDWLESVDTNDMVIRVKGQEIPLSKGFKEEVLRRLQQL